MSVNLPQPLTVIDLKRILERLSPETEVVFVDKDKKYRRLTYARTWEAGQDEMGELSTLFPEDYQNLEDTRVPRRVLILA